MTKIVKATMVVDDRPHAGHPAPTLDTLATSQAVLKRQIIEHGAPQHQTPQPTRQTYLDELNRLRVEIKQAKDELRDLGRRIEETRAETTDRQARRKVEFEDDAMPEESSLETAAQILQDAKNEASEILGTAMTDAARIAEEAKNEGYLEGFSKGYEEATGEFISRNDPLEKQITRILDELSGYKEAQLRNNEQDLVKLVTEIARKVITKTLADDPSTIADMLRGIVEQNSHEQYIKISLAPDLLPVRAKVNDDVKNLLENLGANVTVLIDPSLDEGGLLAEMPGGIVDMGINTQLDNLTGALMGK